MNVPHVACKKCQSTQMSKWRKSPALSKQVSWRRTILAAPFTSQKTSLWMSYLDSTMFLIPPFSFSSSSHLILASLFLQTAFTSLHGQCQMRSIPSKTEFRIPCELASCHLHLIPPVPSPGGSSSGRAWWPHVPEPTGTQPGIEYHP